MKCVVLFEEEVVKGFVVMYACSKHTHRRVGC